MFQNRPTYTSGHVDRVELHNFKSWRHTQTIGPFSSGFTAVVGSNGSGKSNLLDSISFVTGVKARKLRGDQLRDLIYNADNQAAGENRKMKVSLVYVCGSGELEGKEEGEEIVFSRTVQYNATGSVFEIGKRRVAFDEYEQVLSKLNVLVGARNFLIFQGDVEATATKTPGELLVFFEQIAKSDAYKNEYERLREEKDRQEKSALERINQAKIAKAERKDAKDQKDETDKYNALRNERDDLRVEFALFQLFMSEEQVKKARLQLEQAKSSVSEAESVEIGMSDEVKKAKAEAAGKAREVSKADQAAQAASKHASNLQTGSVKKFEALAREKAKKKDAESSFKSAKETLENQGKEIGALKEAIGTFTQREAEFKSAEANAAAQAASSAAAASEALTDQQRATLETLRAEADKATTELKADESRVERDIETAKDRLVVAKTNQDQLSSRANEITLEKSALSKRKQKMDASVNQLQTKVSEHERLRKERVQESAKAREELEGKKIEMDQAKTQLNISKARTAESKRTKKLQESVQALSRHFQGVRGRLVDLVRPTNRKYALAVDTALGKHMDSIVVESEAVAFECVKYLREQRLGTATFLPLDTIRAKTVSEEKRRLTGGQSPYRLCIDLIEIDDSTIEKAVRFAAADAMVCESLQDARKLCFQNNIRVKAVTVEGHLISARGEMTGGAMGGEGRVDRFADNALQGAKDTIMRLEREIADLERKCEAIDTTVSQPDSDAVNAQNRFKFAKTDSETTAVKIADCDARLQQMKQALDTAAEKVTDLVQEIATLGSNLAQVRADIVGSEESIFENAAALGLKGNARDIERRDAEQRSKWRQDLADVNEQLKKLESQLRYVESRDRMATVKECEQALRECDERVAELEAESKKAKEALEEAEQVAQKAEANKSRATNQEDVAQSKVKDAQKRMADASKERGANAKRVTQIASEVQKALTKKREVGREAALDGLDLPLKSAGATAATAATRRRTSGTAAAVAEEGAAQVITAVSTMLMDTDEIDFLILENPTCKSEVEYLSEIKSLSERVEQLAPNARADTRFQEATERLKDTDVQLTDAREAAKAAERAFEIVHRKRYDAFMSMFSHVQDSIDGVYKELTKRESAPLGGHAVLALEDEENPFLGGIKFECMPPNKRFRNMSELSGGEKTVAALALLFAIHAFRPSPFFVLDEVDAALDNNNVSRVSQYIRSRSRVSGDNAPAEDEDASAYRPFQSLVISLKDNFYDKADALVGVYRDIESDSSKSVTLDLSQYAF